MSSTEENSLRVLKVVQELLLDEHDKSAVTPAVILSKIDLVLALNPRWRDGLDHAAITDELIRRFSLWIGRNSTLANNVGHKPWLTAARKQDWRYWQRYREWLERELSWKAIEALDQSTDTVLGMMEDPKREGPWDRRGLVVGHVQSGKTGNYTGLICKAADAGYKVIVVLAGLHNNLRSQTQIRLDEGFLGYKTAPIPDEMEVVGVGEIDGDPAIRPNYATNRDDKGDFNTSVARNFGVTPDNRPWLFVVKKNKTVLSRLYGWIRNHVANSQEAGSGRKIVTHLPLLVIDDEADHASVDTGEQIFNSNGEPDKEYEPKAINSLIRKILHSFSRSAYVGYTATPFANIFIHDAGETREEGLDLFPSSFIVNLAAPSNYIGPAKVFGLPSPEGRDGGLPLIRIVDDYSSSDGVSGWMPHRHKNGHIPLFQGLDKLPASLVEAIDAFILTCAARRALGQGAKHCSMLIHVTRFNTVQRDVYRQVDEHIGHVRQRLHRRIDHDNIIARLQRHWINDFVPTSEEIRQIHPDMATTRTPEWDEILRELPDAIADIQIRTINGHAKDALDYSENEKVGLKVIAIGGDKLARGLTLSGLCVSYFLRASKMYDTLMQMGRWFGYRPRYLDLCRLYTTDELVEWFRHIADASEELREEFDLMAATGGTPDKYGLKVQSHSVLMVTSRLKMRSARDLYLSFSGQLLETVTLHRDAEILIRNIAQTTRFLSALKNPEIDPIRRRGDGRQQWRGYLWRDVPATDVVEFFSGYQTHRDAYKVSSAHIAEFIQSMSQAGELSKWTVALIGGGEGRPWSPLPDIRVDTLKRKSNGSREDRYSIGRLLSSRDESIDLDEGEWEAALAATRIAWRSDAGRRNSTDEPDVPNGPAIRAVRGFGAEGVQPHPERGVLLIYALDPAEAECDFPTDTPPVIAVGVSFPGSDAGLRVRYKVNNVQWEQDYGPAD
jgi:hypothetical protein